ncbi:hypothetical protein EUX98_g2597 [Antrodiella citrinella]|uniref:beta-galactosidase n=1 Tax=Antrodiella citrinella TaxID=2447956 RepID=A0A4S4MYN8_9APHY|nr:hypothetical protein EUX98_g2597 [Antrodiella citrinella]
MSSKKHLPEYARSDALESHYSLKTTRDDDYEAQTVASPLRMAWLKYRAWTLPAIISLIIVLLGWPATARSTVSSVTASESVVLAEPPRNSTGLTDAVQWDNYTLFINDQRIFIHSGEFHTFRLPIPDLWLDIFQKMVASGLNAVSIYIHWGLTNPAPGVLDFDDWRSLQTIFDAAKLAGIFIVLRPGPYINAETTAGGIAHWATSLVASELRTNATDFKDAWTPYIDGIINATVHNQISSGGPVIVTSNYHQYHAEVNPSQPWYMPEFQGGAFDPWGGPGYDACELLTGPDFQDVFYKENWASNVKLISYYMVYGGTSWGGIPFPGVYTSYDYGSAIRESRALSPKFDELKRQALFIRSSPELRKTDWIGDTSTGIPGVTLNGSAAFVTLLRNPDTNTGFFIARQNNSTSTDDITFSISLPTSQGVVTLPQTFSSIALNGRQSKVLLTDYSFGSKSSLLYSTASVFFAGIIDRRDVLFLFGNADQSHEFALSLTGNGGVRASQADVKFTTKPGTKGSTLVTVLPGVKGLVTIFESVSQLVLFSDPVTAATFWAPTIPSASGDLKNFWQFGSNDTVLVGGPYLVRNATITKSGELALRGDLNQTAILTVIAPSTVKLVSWNGEEVPTMVAASTSSGGPKSSAIRTGRVDMKLTGNPILVLGRGLDRGQPYYNEYYRQASLRGWSGAVCCENIVLWRGHFMASGSEKSVNLTINGGSSFAASVFLNEQFLASTSGGDQTNALYIFPTDSVNIGEDNVITVIQDNMGNDEDDNEKSARGIPGFQLNDGNFTEWKVQGKIGGYTGYPDKTRGIFNEGGLFGEREGWHLPGFDTSSWTSRSFDQGLPSGKAGVGFFVTTFDLDIAKDTDVFMSFTFDEINQPYRALLFVNGWNFGKAGIQYSYLYRIC